jgi:prevent-host-death family protein
MKSVTTHEAKTRLSALLKQVEDGEEIEIRRGRVAVARLTSVRKAKARTRARPASGTVTSHGVTYEAEAFDALDAAELERWGLS